MIEKFRLRWIHLEEEFIEEFKSFETLMTRYYVLKNENHKPEIGVRSTKEMEFKGFTLKPNMWCGILL